MIPFILPSQFEGLRVALKAWCAAYVSDTSRLGVYARDPRDRKPVDLLEQLAVRMSTASDAEIRDALELLAPFADVIAIELEIERPGVDA